jgi:hypothetical protein
MKTAKCPPHAPISGLAIMAQSRFGCIFHAIGKKLDTFARIFSSVLHIAMVVAIGAILFAVIFANQHIPCWYDEICMLDPAYYRTTTGIWHSAAQWNSIDTVPFAPNYPLLINLLRLPIAFFGCNFWILRGSMLVFGLLPVAALLFLFRRNGLFKTWAEILQATFFSACGTFFYWSVYIRPEGILISVATLLVVFWSTDQPVLLFLSALLVPLCGLHWNVLLLPVALHWLVFGGRLRNPLLVAIAFALASAGTIAAYHLLGMWPSYLQEAARVGGLAVLPSVLAKLRATFTCWDVSWLLNPVALPPFLALCAAAFLAPGALAQRTAAVSSQERKAFFFVLLSLSVVVVLSLVHMDRHYIRPLLLAVFLLAPVFLRSLFRRHPAVLLPLLLVSLYAARVNWAKTAGQFAASAEFPEDARWTDEAFLSQTLAARLSPDDVPLCPNSAYFAVRAHCKDLLPLCYAFDIGEDRQRSVTAVLLEDLPVSMLHMDCSIFRHTSYGQAMLARFSPPDNPCADPDAVRVSPDELLAAIADKWHCAFTEIPLPSSPKPRAIHYRLFRPVFPPAEAPSPDSVPSS